MVVIAGNENVLSNQTGKLSVRKLLNVPKPVTFKWKNTFITQVMFLMWQWFCLFNRYDWVRGDAQQQS